MWQYVQETGGMYHPDGTRLAQGYSGSSPFRSLPEAQCRKNQGPIPRGIYSIGSANTSITSVTLPLVPASSNRMCGRSGSLIHRDNRSGTESRGCIILARAARMEIRDSDDRQLLVVATEADLPLRVEVANADA